MDHLTIREHLEAYPTEYETLEAPDMEADSLTTCPYRVAKGYALHDPVYLDPSDQTVWSQANVAYLRHPVSQKYYAMILAVHADREGYFYEFVNVSPVLDCESWDEFKDIICAVHLDTDHPLNIDRYDPYVELMPAWFSHSDAI